MLNTLIIAFAIFLGILIGVDMIKNPQSYRNIALRLRDSYWQCYFYPGRVLHAYAHTPRHSRSKPLPDFMRHWHLL